MKNRIARDDADNASAGDHGHLLHADGAHAVEQRERGFFRRGPVEFFLGQHDGLHGGNFPIMLRHRMERLRGHQSDQLFVRDHQMSPASRAKNFPRVVLE